MIKASLEEIMSEQPITVEEDTNVGAVAHLLMRYRINGILVVAKNDKNKLVGVVTTTDLLKLLDEVLEGGGQKMSGLKEISQMPVSAIASQDVVSVQVTEKVVKVLALMQKKNIHTIPVYEKDKLVGVVGKHDILNAALF